MQNQNMFNSTVLQYREIKYILCTLVARIFKPNKTGVVHNAAYIIIFIYCCGPTQWSEIPQCMKSTGKSTTAVLLIFTYICLAACKMYL